MDSNIDNNQNEISINRKQNDSLIKLMRPWGSILAIACIATVYYTTFQQKDENDELIDSIYHYNDRQLLEEGTHEHHHHHAHKPVYNEAHKPLFPLTPNDYNGFFWAILSLVIAAGGGIGGGGMLVPIYILIMGFSPKHAIPLSNVTVFGGAIANNLLNFSKRHPLADRPLIDWDLILVMEPLTIAGALCGAFLNKLLPELLLTVLLVALLSFTAYTSLEKAVKMYKKETIAILAARESELVKLGNKIDTNEHEEAENGLLKEMEEEEDDEQKEKNNILRAKNIDLAKILEEERFTPKYNLTILIIMFIVVLAVNILKGGGAFQSPLGIVCGSSAFWFSNIFVLVWIFTISYLAREYLVSRQKRKEACGYELVIGDIKWDERATIVYPGICCFAGFFAGMFGVGGGIVKGPLMLAMGIHPAVGSASSAAMILMTSFTATTSYIVFGLLIPDYAFMFIFIGFASTIAGQVGLSMLMKKSNRNSYIVFSIGGAVLISSILMSIQSMLSLAAGEKHHSGGVCGKGD